MNSDAPTRPRSLADRVVAILSDDILLRRMRPGAALKEAELCDRFNISRPVVRDHNGPPPAHRAATSDLHI